MNTIENLVEALREARSCATYFNQETGEGEVYLSGSSEAWMEKAQEALEAYDAEQNADTLYCEVSGI